jgi:hypothetical protein
VQILINAGADPTIPAGRKSPLNRAISPNNNAVVALLRRAIASHRARTLHKARALLDANPPVCLQGRVERGEPLPTVEFISQQQQGDDERLRATAAFAAGFDGDCYKGLPRELYVELLGFMLPPGADKGPEA